MSQPPKANEGYFEGYFMKEDRTISVPDAAAIQIDYPGENGNCGDLYRAMSFHGMRPEGTPYRFITLQQDLRNIKEKHIDVVRMMNANNETCR